ncbi:hypothetical protein [Planomicrobium soli]|uniref:hypothetical protein n=1 Tax=Planomicrobium soli TaxID=1176648 RepID=UPI000D0D6E35|nr:hypothetical protein [Planomicrobium soli]
MENVKIHPLILLALGISALSIGIRAYENYAIGNEKAGIALGVLCVFFTVLAAYGWLRNRRIERINRRIKKGQKLIR